VNIRQVAQVGLGLLGVWALLTAVETFIQIAGVVGVSRAPLALAEVLPVTLMLGLSYLLIFHNAKAATAIFPDVEAATGPAPSDFSRTLIALTGVMLLVQAAPTTVNAILNYFSVGQTDPTLRGRLVERFIGSLVPIGAGIYLIAHRERLLDYLQRALPEHVADESDAPVV
jgi:hypothetical protein